MANVIIFGTGRGATVAHRYLSKDSEHKVCAFAVETEFARTESFCDLPVVDFSQVEKLYPPTDFSMFVPLGNQEMNKLRYQKYTACKEKGFKLISYVSSTIPFKDDLTVGENCFILENNSINFDVRIGNNVTIWSANQIGDSSIIEDHCWITSQVCLAGGVTIKSFSFLGINCSVSNGVTIAEENFIGANALITKSTNKKEVFVVPPTPKAAFPSDRFVSMLKGQY